MTNKFQKTIESLKKIGLEKEYNRNFNLIVNRMNFADEIIKNESVSSSMLANLSFIKSRLLR